MLRYLVSQSKSRLSNVCEKLSRRRRNSVIPPLYACLRNNKELENNTVCYNVRVFVTVCYNLRVFITVCYTLRAYVTIFYSVRVFIAACDNF